MDGGNGGKIGWNVDGGKLRGGGRLDGGRC